MAANVKLKANQNMVRDRDLSSIVAVRNLCKGAMNIAGEMIFLKSRY